MKSNSGAVLVSIKSNNEIFETLKKAKRINLPFTTIWISRSKELSNSQYALLVNKSQFKLAVTRNKIKRQLRNILIASELKKGMRILIKPNSLILKREYSNIKELINETINKYQNGK